MNPYVPFQLGPPYPFAAAPPRIRPQGGGLDPNAPEFIPQAVAKVGTVSLGSFGAQPRGSPQFVSHGGFKPTVLMAPTATTEEASAPPPPPPPPPKTWANVAKESKDLPAEPPTRPPPVVVAKPKPAAPKRQSRQQKTRPPVHKQEPAAAKRRAQEDTPEPPALKAEVAPQVEAEIESTEPTEPKVVESTVKPSVDAKVQPSVKAVNEKSVAPESSIKAEQSEADKPAAVKSEADKPAAVKPAAVEPEAAKPAAVEPAAVEPEAVKPAAVEPEAAKPAAVEPAAVEPAPVEPVESSAEVKAVDAPSLEPTSTIRNSSTRASGLFESARVKSFLPGLSNKGGLHSANVMLEAMRTGSKLAGLDSESQPVMERRAAGVEGPIALSMSRNSRDKIVYPVDMLLSVQGHPSCNNLSEDLKQSDMSSILKRDGSSGGVLESLYRNKGRTTSSNSQFSMPAVLKPGSNLLEMNMHVWSSNKRMSRSQTLNDSDWQRSSSRVVQMPTNVEIPEVPEDSWQVKQREQKEEGESNIKLLRRLRAQLNKMTPATYQAIFEAILAIGIDTEDQAEQFGQLIFDKAITNHQYIEMYANLCTDLRRDLERRNKADFKRVLLNCCQKTFDSTLSNDFVPPENADEEEVFEALLLHKRKMKGNLMFVGALASASLISARILTHCVRQLLHGQKPLQLEALAAFIPTIKSLMLSSKEKESFTHMYEEIQEMSENPDLELRIQCLLKDAVEQRPLGSTISAGRTLSSTRTITTDGFAAAPRTRSNR